MKKCGRCIFMAPNCRIATVFYGGILDDYLILFTREIEDIDRLEEVFFQKIREYCLKNGDPPIESLDEVYESCLIDVDDPQDFDFAMEDSIALRFFLAEVGERFVPELEAYCRQGPTNFDSACELLNWAYRLNSERIKKRLVRALNLEELKDWQANAIRAIYRL